MPTTPGIVTGSPTARTMHDIGVSSGSIAIATTGAPTVDIEASTAIGRTTAARFVRVTGSVTAKDSTASTEPKTTVVVTPACPRRPCGMAIAMGSRWAVVTRDGQRLDPGGAKWYRNGDRNYDRRYGSRDDYKRDYRVAFQEGYEEGFRIRLQ